jgi:hypothetical protein
MIASLLLVVAALVLPTILFLGVLVLLGSAVVAVAEGATTGLIKGAATDAA